MPRSESHEHPSALRSRIAVVMRIFVWPASIFCSVRIFRSAYSASLSWVTRRLFRSRLRFPPNICNRCDMGSLARTPHCAASGRLTERHNMP